MRNKNVKISKLLHNAVKCVSHTSEIEGVYVLTQGAAVWMDVGKRHGDDEVWNPTGVRPAQERESIASLDGELSAFCTVDCDCAPGIKTGRCSNDSTCQ